MNKERQRKLEARKRRQESLANAFPSTIQVPPPKDLISPVKKELSRFKPASEYPSLEKRGPGRPHKNALATGQVKMHTGRGKEKSK